MRLTTRSLPTRRTRLWAAPVVLALGPLLLIAAACGSGPENANSTGKVTTSASTALSKSSKRPPRGSGPENANSTGTVTSSASTALSTSSKHTTQYSFEFFDVPGATSTEPSSINDLGDVVGDYSDATGVFHGFTRSKGGSITTIDVDGAVETSALGNNDWGDIVGGFVSASGDQFGFMRSARGTTTVIDFEPFPGIAETYVGAINNRREMVGGYGPDFDIGFLLRDGRFTALPDPPGSSVPAFTFPYGINDFGVITGQFLDTNGDSHGYVLRGTHYTQVDFSDGTQSGLSNVNDLGQTPGIYVGADGLLHGFIFDTTRNISVPFDCPLGYSTVFFGINNRGQLAGSCRTVANGPRHGVIATPVKSDE
jgi:hypothetical protein